MVLSIRIGTRGIQQFNIHFKRFNKYPGRTKKDADKIGRILRRLARRLAPKFTGSLKESISYEVQPGTKGYKIVLYSDIRYSHFQEYGFTPHYVKIRYMKEWLDAHATGAPGHEPSIPGYVFVKKYTPHIVPAIEATRGDIGMVLNEGVVEFTNNILKKVYE